MTNEKPTIWFVPTLLAIYALATAIIAFLVCDYRFRQYYAMERDRTSIHLQSPNGEHDIWISANDSGPLITLSNQRGNVSYLTSIGPTGVTCTDEEGYVSLTGSGQPRIDISGFRLTAEDMRRLQLEQRPLIPARELADGR